MEHIKTIIKSPMDKYIDIAKKRKPDCTFLDRPAEFFELFKNKNFNLVKLYDIRYMREIGTHLGEFKWENNTLTSLDKDSYDIHMKVHGYREYTYHIEDEDDYGDLDDPHPEELSGLEIIVDEW